MSQSYYTSDAGRDAGAAAWNAAQNAPPEVKSAAADYATQQAKAEVKKTCGLDMTYVRSRNGALKGSQLGWSFLAFFLMCIQMGISIGKVFFALFIFPTMLCVIVLFFAFATQLYEKKPQVPWFQADVGISAGATVVYPIMAIIIITTGRPLLIASGIFAIVAAGLGFAPGTYYSYQRYRESKYPATEQLP
ncbi:uncharacterized protein [Amphiura filiformis]|uniref:uncharacterized protein isoform X2 n=1 Tax=Amphiura filiformis TaxID=82378 RepID=UPI003B218A0F